MPDCAYLTHFDEFWLINLFVAPHIQAIEDPDPLINCQFMENRDTFLIVCREKHYEFSSLRRAKYSSLVLLYELHSRNYEKENKTEFIYTCDTCAQKISAGYHCTVCDVSIGIRF